MLKFRKFLIASNFLLMILLTGFSRITIKKISFRPLVKNKIKLCSFELLWKWSLSILGGIFSVLKCGLRVFYKLVFQQVALHAIFNANLQARQVDFILFARCYGSAPNLWDYLGFAAWALGGWFPQTRQKFWKIKILNKAVLNAIVKHFLITT